MKRIFISYSRRDEPFARQLTYALEQMGIDVWVDFDDIPAGKKWSSAIQEGLETSDGMVVVISPDAMASNNVEDEWQYFMDHGHPVIPILWRPAHVHFQLNRKQYVDFHQQAFNKAFAQLIDEFERHGVDLKIDDEEAEETAQIRSSQIQRRIDEDKPTVTVAKVQHQIDEDKPTVTVAKVQHQIDEDKPTVTVAKVQHQIDEDKATVAKSTAPTSRRKVFAISALFVLLAGLLLLILSQSSKVSFDTPPPLVFIAKSFVVYEEPMIDANTFYITDSFIVRSFELDNTFWYEIETVDGNQIGYQFAEDIPFDYLGIVPHAIEYASEATEIRLFDDDDFDSPSASLVIEPMILIFGFRVDGEQIWYRVQVSEPDSEPKLAWLPDNDLGLEGSIPVIAHTLNDTDTYWDEQMVNYALEIKADSELFVFYPYEEHYFVAIFIEDNLETVWIEADTVDLNEETRDFLR
jgi:TIR domain-containing protein